MSIFIVSISSDLDTSQVVKWIRYFKVNFYRLNLDTNLSIRQVLLGRGGSFEVSIGEKNVDLDTISGFWYRKGDINLNVPNSKSYFSSPIDNLIQSNLLNEFERSKEFLHQRFSQIRHLGDRGKAKLNKLIVLEAARSCEITIPQTLLTSSKDVLTRFIKKYPQIICKAISESLSFSDSEIGSVFGYTNVIERRMMKTIPDTFQLSLFQEKVDKKYELRIFFLDSKFYSMAIFSQADLQTAVDFRRYNERKPNRTVPYNLPVEVSDKLRRLMKKLDLDTASIDMAVSRSAEYFFFEVNPVGQIGMTSNPCNYGLHRKIAEYLINKDE